MVPKAGLEPAHREAQASETCVSTNSTTWAKKKERKGTRLGLHTQALIYA
jgi:hypothetical protein